MKYISAVTHKIDDSHFALIYPVNQGIIKTPVSVPEGLQLLFDDSDEERKTFIEYVENDEYNISPLRFKETIRYCCRIVGNETIDIQLKNETNKYVNIEQDSDRKVFQYVNYLGKTNISFIKDGIIISKLEFEVVPDKIKYKEDYVELTKAIADESSTLLLDYTSPTSLSFSHNSKKEATPLEQFIFLRTFCYSENLESLFASIKRNPDRLLVSEDELRPFGMGIPSAKFFSNPFSNSRGWIKTNTNNYVPSEISVVHKYDSYDTPANRFIKTALLQFSEVCQKIIDNVETDKTEYYNEAKQIITTIDDILNDSFFDEINDLEIMPVNNQVLEKREGYSQIFAAFSMLNLALQLNWSEQEDVYNGEIKNTALLYEYWLFFELRKILIELAGKQKDSSQIEPFNQFASDKNGLTVFLQQGTTSLQTFVFENDIRVNLYYNRTFSATEFSNSIYWGSYSRPFRPDYTIALFPNEFKSEKEAIKAGEVSYIHFDAKYRVQDLTKFINTKKIEIKDDSFENIENNVSKDISDEISEEKKDSITNTYKRGDLLKMHTYNDAIRRTIGSYVLYPGTNDSQNNSDNTSVYDEILPGVGAFAIRPGNENAGHKEIKKFINQIIQFKIKQATRQYRKDYFENMVIQAPGESIKNSLIKDSSIEYTMIGFVRDEYYNFLIQNKFLPTNKDEFLRDKPYTFYFYFYAINKGKVYTIHKETSKSKYLKITTTDVKNAKVEFGYHFEHLEPWTAEIESIELVSKDSLQEKLDSLYSEKKYRPEKGFQADFYYLVKASVNIYDEGVKAVAIVENDDISLYSPKIIILPK